MKQFLSKHFDRIVDMFTDILLAFATGLLVLVGIVKSIDAFLVNGAVKGSAIILYTLILFLAPFGLMAVVNFIREQFSKESPEDKANRICEMINELPREEQEFIDDFIDVLLINQDKKSA